MNICEILPTGKENALHQAELAAIMGVSRATVKAMVREARKNGTEIMSGSCGYYFPKNNEERRAFVSMFSKQAYSRLKTTKPIKSTLKNISGQMSLTDDYKGTSKEAGGEAATYGTDG